MTGLANDRVLDLTSTVPMVTLSPNANVPGREVDRPVAEDATCDVCADTEWKTGDAESLESVARGSACSPGDRLDFEP